MSDIALIDSPVDY